MKTEIVNKYKALFIKVKRPVHYVTKVLGWIPFSLLGGLVLLGLFFSYQFARNHADYVLKTLVFCTFFLICFTFLEVVLVFLRLVLKRKITPGAIRELEAQIPVQTGFRLRYLSLLPFIQVSWKVVEPPCIDTGNIVMGWTLQEELIFSERGFYKNLIREFVIRDVFGFFRLRFRLKENQDVKIYPSRGKLVSEDLYRSLATGDIIPHPHGTPEGDYVEMRKYGPGDPLRRILWKTFARTRNLMVRMPERSFSPPKKSIAYLISGEEDEPAAALARIALEKGLLGTTYEFSTDGSGKKAMGLNDAIDKIIMSRQFRHQAGHGLNSFLDEVDPARTGSCIIFAPAKNGAWIDFVLTASKKRPNGIQILMGMDAFSLEPAQTLLHRMLFRAEKKQDLPGDEVARTVQRLVQARIPLHVFDRTHGLILTETILSGFRRDEKSADEEAPKRILSTERR